MAKVAQQRLADMCGKATLEMMAHRFGLLAHNISTMQASPYDAPASKLQAILREIDETVLPREVSLLVDGKEKAKAYIAERRLRHLALADAKQDESGTTIAEVARALAHIARINGALTTRVSRPAQALSDDLWNYSSASLKVALGGTHTTSASMCLRDMVSDTSRAWLTWEDDAVQTAKHHGDKQLEDILKNTAVRFLEQQRGRHAADFIPDGMAGVVVPLNSDDVILISCEGTQGFAAALSHAAAMTGIEMMQLIKS